MTKSTSQTVATGLKPLLPAVAVHHEKPITPAGPQQLTSSSISAVLPTKAVKATFTIGGNEMFLKSSEIVKLFKCSIGQFQAPVKYDLLTPTSRYPTSRTTDAVMSRKAMPTPEKALKKGNHFHI